LFELNSASFYSDHLFIIVVNELRRDKRGVSNMSICNWISYSF